MINQDKRIKLLQHKQNQGYGAAVWDGLKAAKGEIIFFCDSDRQFRMEELPSFIAFTKLYDVVIGYRAPRRDPMMRKLNAWGWKTLINAFFGVKIKDVDCAFKAFKRPVLRSLKVQSRGAMFSAELLIRLIAKKTKIIQVPVGHYPRRAGRPTGAKLKVIIRAFRDLFEIKSELKKTLEKIPKVDRRLATLR